MTLMMNFSIGRYNTGWSRNFFSSIFCESSYHL